MEATFYGLPMYRVGADGGEGASVLPPRARPAATRPTRPRAARPRSPSTCATTSSRSTTSAAPTGDVDERGAAGRPAPADPAEADRGRHLGRGPGARVPARVADDRPTTAGVDPAIARADDRPGRARAGARVGRAVLPGHRRDGRAAGDRRGPARHPDPDGGLVPRRRPAPQPGDGRPRPALDLGRLRAADDPPRRRPGRERRLLDPGRGRGRRHPRRHRPLRDRRRPGGRRRDRVAPRRTCR